jgi:hypothetical protein
MEDAVPMAHWLVDWLVGLMDAAAGRWKWGVYVLYCAFGT